MSKTRPLHLFGNWKMNMSGAKTESFFEALLPVASVRGKNKNVVLSIFPPSIYLERAYRTIRKLGLEEIIFLGVQNVFSKGSGAFTGEISPEMAMDAGARYAILGHSERRSLFGESPEIVGEKVTYCASKGLLPVLCVGETLCEREEGRAWEIIERQLSVGLAGVEKSSPLIVAYEPVWAIGTGRSASPQDAEAMCRSIRRWLGDARNSPDLPILYGGSVNPGNSRELFSMDNIDGGLIGGASLDPDTFVAMIP